MKSLSLAAVAASLSGTFLSPAYADQPLHYDVEAMEVWTKQQNAEFTVESNWVTDFLASGGNIRDITGLEQPSDVSAWKNSRFIEPATNLPAAFDWRSEVAGGMQPIKNQGACGSCWAFSVTAVLESLLRIQDPTTTFDLAEQTLVSTCSSAGSCSGGYFSAFNYLKNPGLADEASDPYRAQNTNCRSGLRAKAKIKEWAYIRGATGGAPSIEQLKTAIMTYGPIAATVNASFTSYAGGIYSACNRSSVNHMVNIEGWDDETQSWIMRNSWGSNWGEDGYMRIKYTDRNGYKCNNIASTAAYAIL
jgi:C1A family cysteine protease